MKFFLCTETDKYLIILFFFLIFHSWTNAKMKKFIHSWYEKNLRIIFCQWKRITKFNDSFFRIKVYTFKISITTKFVKVFEQAIFVKVFEQAILGVKIFIL